jgi:endonuclease/exonuclease/phosphatase family metal-dependent hydrolase
VRATGADVVLLQEVDRRTERSGRVDQPATLARLTGYHAAFGSTLAYQGGEYGLAVLSRWPIARDTLIPLPVEPPPQRAGGSVEPRGALHVTVAAPADTLRLLNTHLDASADDHYRRQEAATLLAIVARLRERGALVLAGGDFNALPASDVYAALRRGGLRDVWEGCGRGEGLTFPAAAPVKRIDYLFAAGAVECDEGVVLPGGVSDHRGVLFTLRLPGADGGRR